MEKNILKKIMKDLFLIELIRKFLSIVLPNTGYFRLASLLVKLSKPVQFLFPSKIKDMMSLMPTSFPKKTIKQKEIYKVNGKKIFLELHF